MKNIYAGDYWTVIYKDIDEPKRTYKGIVLVKSWCDKNNGWKCEIAQDLEDSWYNKIRGCLFQSRDFKSPSTKEKFLLERINFIRG